MLIAFDYSQSESGIQTELGLSVEALEAYLNQLPQQTGRGREGLWPILPIAVIIGPNGSGKSTFLNALKSLSACLRPQTRQAKVSPTQAQLSRQSLQSTRYIWAQVDRKRPYVLIGRCAPELSLEQLEIRSIDPAFHELCLGKKRSAARLQNAAAVESEERIALRYEAGRLSLTQHVNGEENTVELEVAEKTRGGMMAYLAYLAQGGSKTESGRKVLETVIGEARLNFLLRSMQELSAIEVDLIHDDEQEWLEISDEMLKTLLRESGRYHERLSGLRHEHLLDKMKRLCEAKRQHSIKEALSSLSRSERRCALILAKLLSEGKHRVYCFEHPEQNLYMENVELLSMVFHDLVEEQRVEQIILTSHYPNFLDHFSLREIWFFEDPEAHLGEIGQEDAWHFSVKESPFGSETESEAEQSEAVQSEAELEAEQKGQIKGRRAYCLESNALVRELIQEGLKLSQIWYGGYF